MAERQREAQPKTISLNDGKTSKPYILRKLGEGSFGIVFTAVSKSGNIYVLKFPDPALDDKMLLQQELNIHLALQKIGEEFKWDHINKLADIQNQNGILNGELVLILEFCNGRDCDSWIGDFPSVEREESRKIVNMSTTNNDLVSYLGRLCVATKHTLMGVKEVHRHGYSHRDIALRNMFVSALNNNTFNIKLGDLGGMIPEKDEKNKIYEVTGFIDLLCEELEAKMKISDVLSEMKIAKNLLAFFSQLSTINVYNKIPDEETSETFINKILEYESLKVVKCPYHKL